jgi:hypothetical protein
MHVHPKALLSECQNFPHEKSRPDISGPDPGGPFRRRKVFVKECWSVEKNVNNDDTDILGIIRKKIRIHDKGSTELIIRIDIRQILNITDIAKKE